MARKSGRQQQKSRQQRSRQQRTRQQRSRQQRQQQRTRQQRSKNPRQQKRRTQKKRPMNAFMQKLNQARNNNQPSFEYNGKSYNRRELKTGMVVYKSA